MFSTGSFRYSVHFLTSLRCSCSSPFAPHPVYFWSFLFHTEYDAFMLKSLSPVLCQKDPVTRIEQDELNRWLLASSCHRLVVHRVQHFIDPHQLQQTLHYHLNVLLCYYHHHNLHPLHFLFCFPLLHSGFTSLGLWQVTWLILMCQI